MVMRAVEKYKQNAEECRKLANLLSMPDDKNVLEAMAAHGKESLHNASAIYNPRIGNSR
jgi:hypothetical protein